MRVLTDRKVNLGLIAPMRRNKTTVMDVHAPAARPSWQVAALLALAVAVPAGVVIELLAG
jgi:hypothetical protein